MLFRSGLTLALGLTEAMGGTLAVDSVPGEGTTVTMTLRLAGQQSAPPGS